MTDEENKNTAPPPPPDPPEIRSVYDSDNTASDRKEMILED
jgi:hypothetical protein